MPKRRFLTAADRKAAWETIAEMRSNRCGWEEIADELGISRITLQRWRKRHLELREMIEEAERERIQLLRETFLEGGEIGARVLREISQDERSQFDERARVTAAKTLQESSQKEIRALEARGGGSASPEVWAAAVQAQLGLMLESVPESADEPPAPDRDADG